MSKSYNVCLDTDSYKVSMWKQYPQNTEYVYSYIESRGGRWDSTLFTGVQSFAKKLVETRVTKHDVDIAKRIWEAHGEPFNYDGWMYIVNELDGKLPVVIRAAREGLVIPTKNVLCTIENTDPKCYWLTTWLETPLLRAIWYPTTVATQSWEIKQVIKSYLEKSGTPDSINFKCHDFGARGVSSEESAAIGAAAHLINFMGTDTMSGILHVMDVYGDDVCGFSIPASEHSTITSWGRENEVDAYRNMVKQFGESGKILAVVSDSYDIYNACKLWGTELKDDVVNSGATVVIRPDSGEPIDVLPRMLKILEEHFGVTIIKGYKLLNNVRVLWGDGINYNSIQTILRTVVDIHGYSADNIAFGMGGALLQQIDRDVQKFAMKCSSIEIRQPDGSLLERDVFKDPITDKGKSSKKGRVTLYKTTENGYMSLVEVSGQQSELETYYRDGQQLFTQTFSDVRVNSNL